MPKATVAQPFIWRTGHKAVLIEKGEQQLTQDQQQYAHHHGYLQDPAKQHAKKESLKEKIND